VGRRRIVQCAVLLSQGKEHNYAQGKKSERIGGAKSGAARKGGSLSKDQARKGRGASFGKNGPVYKMLTEEPEAREKSRLNEYSCRAKGALVLKRV